MPKTEPNTTNSEEQEKQGEAPVDLNLKHKQALQKKERPHQTLIPMVQNRLQDSGIGWAHSWLVRLLVGSDLSSG
jgi:hypothetical protein